MNSKPLDYSNTDIFHLTIPVLALDVVIFTVYHGKLCVVTIPMENGKSALPGGIVANGESLEAAFDRILLTKTGITGVYKEQLYTFGDPKRDKRWHVVSVVYYALVDTEKLLSTGDLTKVAILPVRETNESMFWYDHASIISYAKQRLEWKMEYTNVASQILGSEFTLSELQNTYEAVFNKSFDKRNFRKKILSIGIIEETGNTDKTRSKRPAMLYRFVREDITIVDFI